MATTGPPTPDTCTSMPPKVLGSAGNIHHVMRSCVSHNMPTKTPKTITSHDVLTCYPGRHLQECPRTQAGRCLKGCFLSNFGTFLRSAPQRVLRGVGHFEVRSPKSLKKHPLGHFPARVPGHSCRWRPGSQVLTLTPSYEIHVRFA